MIRQLKQKSVFILIALLLLPYTYQLEHNHHHHHDCHQEEVPVQQSFEDNCFICDFHYSAFIQGNNHITAEGATFYDSLIISYASLPYTGHNGFLFLLRAPPALQTA